jgi:4'-phosphopantetheinyl transferase
LFGPPAIVAKQGIGGGDDLAHDGSEVSERKPCRRPMAAPSDKIGGGDSGPPCVTVAPRLQVWTLRVDGADEWTIARWRAVLDETEQARADRFVSARHRAEYTAAHALVRFALSTLFPDAPLAAWRLVAGDGKKPVAWLANQPAPLSFNLSHTAGMVGVAAMPREGCALGFDLEALDREMTLDIADSYFRAEEIAWLATLPQAERQQGFLRLWTLKEAFIKATGEGLSRDLASFWFSPFPPRIHFTPRPAPAVAKPEQTEDWHFEQRIIAGRFVAAVGLHQPRPLSLPASWTEVASSHDRTLFRT